MGLIWAAIKGHWWSTKVKTTFSQSLACVLGGQSTSPMCTCPHLSTRSLALWCARKSDLENKVRLSDVRVQPVLSKYSPVDSAFTTHITAAGSHSHKTWPEQRLSTYRSLFTQRKTYKDLVNGYFQTFLDSNHVHTHNHIKSKQTWFTDLSVSSRRLILQDVEL